MRSRSEVLELAVLGQLQNSPMHGYELRKRLNATLGAFRALSYGSLYPCLKTLQLGGWIEATDTAAPPHALSGKRARIVYQLTAEGKERLASTLSHADPAAWEDDSFDVRFALFGRTDAETRLRILEGRRTRLAERMEAVRETMQRTRERMDAYTEELQRHGLEQVEREVKWLDALIENERAAQAPRTGSQTPQQPRAPRNAPAQQGSKEQQ